MPYTAQNSAVYRDLELDWESGFESPEILADASQARNSRRRKMALAGVVAVAALVCLVPAWYTRGTSPRVQPVTGTVNLNEESGPSLQSIKDKAEASVAKAHEGLKSHVSELHETAKQSAKDLKRTLEDHVEGSKAKAESSLDKVEESKAELAKKAEETVKEPAAEVEQKVKDSAPKLAEEKLQEKLTPSGLEAVKNATAYVEQAAEQAHGHSQENVASANSYAVDNVKQANDYAEAVFTHAAGGSMNAPCIEDHVAYHPLDMQGQHVSYEKDINGCIQRCKDTKGCAHFTFFAADGSCHVTDHKAQPAAKSAGAYAGTAECEEVVVKKMTPEEHAAKSAELANAYAKESLDTAQAYNEGNVKRTQSYTEESLQKALKFAQGNAPALKALEESIAPKAPAPAEPEKEEKDEPANPCFEDHVAYHPLDMTGQHVSYEKDIDACLSRCKDTKGCAHFTFFAADGSCHVTDEKASAAEHSLGAQAGKPGCDEVVFKKL